MSATHYWAPIDLPRQMRPYYVFLLVGVISFAMVGAGVFLVVEHWITWGYLEFELLGHETYGVVMVAIGLCVFAWDWGKLRPESDDA